jgi:hypothetical protein
MIYSTLVVALTAITGFASAQSGNFTSCCNVQPSTIEQSLRLSWCRAQQNTCPEVCPNGQTSVNNCDAVRVHPYLMRSSTEHNPRSTKLNSATRGPDFC